MHAVTTTPGRRADWVDVASRSVRMTFAFRSFVMSPLPEAAGPTAATMDHPDHGMGLLRGAFRERVMVTLVNTTLLPGERGLTNTDTGAVFLDVDAMDDAQLHATFFHELAHLDDPGRSEEEAEQAAARALIARDAALRVAAGEATVSSMARHLGVDPALMRARLRDTDLGRAS